MCHSPTHCVIRMSRTQWVISGSRTECAACRWRSCWLWYVSLINALHCQNVTNSMIHLNVTDWMCSMSMRVVSFVISDTNTCVTNVCVTNPKSHLKIMRVVSFVISDTNICVTNVCVTNPMSHLMIMRVVSFVISDTNTCVTNVCVTNPKSHLKIMRVASFVTSVTHEYTASSECHELTSEICERHLGTRVSWYVSLTNALRHQNVTNPMSYLKITHWMCSMSMRAISVAICVTNMCVTNTCVTNPMSYSRSRTQCAVCQWGWCWLCGVKGCRNFSYMFICICI